MKLLTYAAIRMLIAIPMLLVLLSTVFYVMRVLPGDPVSIMLGEKVPLEEIERVRHILGFDRPIHVQFLSYLVNILKGEFGESLVTLRPVLTELMDAYPTTVELTIGGLLVGVVLGLLTGLIAAVKRDSIIDHILRILSFGVYSMPVFWLGLLLQIYIALSLGLLPITGRISPTISIPRITGLYLLDSLLQLNLAGFVESLRYLILPSLTLGLSLMPRISRIVRASMLDQMQEDYVITARAKGLPERTIIYRHVLRNALLPTITIIGLSFAGLLGGTVLVETVFSMPGLGRLLVQGMLNRDFPIVQGVIVIYATVVVVVNTYTDILYAVFDPRVRY